MYVGHLEQVAQACGAAGGLGAIALTYDRARPRVGLRASQHEVRVLAGMLVAVSALGSMLAALIANTDDPMSTFSFLFAAPGPDPHDLAATCARAASPSSAGPARAAAHCALAGCLVQVAPALLLLLSADGLRRGRRLAWWLAVGDQLHRARCQYLGQVHHRRRPSVRIAGSARGPGRSCWREGDALPVVTLVVLLATRRRLDQTADRRAVRKLTTILVTALAELRRVRAAPLPAADHYDPRPEFGVLIQDLPVRFVAGRPFAPGSSLRTWPGSCSTCRSPAVLDRRPRRAHRVFPAHLHLPRRGHGGPGPRDPRPRRLDAVLHVDLARKAVLDTRQRAGRDRVPGHRRGRGDRGRPVRRPSRARFRDSRVRGVLRAPWPPAVPVRRRRAGSRRYGPARLEVSADRRGHPAHAGASAIRGQEVAGRADCAEPGGQRRDHRRVVELPGGAA